MTTRCTLREFLADYNDDPVDVDLYHWDVDSEAATMVDCSLKDFTEAGLLEFADVLGADVARVTPVGEGWIAVYLTGCKSRRITALSYAHAGDCSETNYAKWFTMSEEA